MAIPAVTTAALLSAPFFVLLFMFGYMATTTPSQLCLEGCICYRDIQNNKLTTLNCTSFRPVLNAASSLFSDFSQIDVLNIQNVVDGSSHYIIDGLFGVFSNVKFMNLINSSIFKIDQRAFKGLKHLEELDISNNQIFKIHSEIFKETPKLKVLDLSFNPLRLGPTTFLRSKSLEVLILSSCNLTSIPAGSLRGLTNLKTIDLYDNYIQSFTIRSFPRNIKHLWLTKNNLTNVPTKALSLLKKLTILDISQNPINCTCSLMGLQDWFSSKGILFDNDVICKYPSYYKGKSWKKVSENEVCFDNEKTPLMSNKEECPDNSCQNEIIHNDSTEEDRYIYNIQADQAMSDIVTEDTGSAMAIFSTGEHDKVAMADFSDETLLTTKSDENLVNITTMPTTIEEVITPIMIEGSTIFPQEMDTTEKVNEKDVVTTTVANSENNIRTKLRVKDDFPSTSATTTVSTADSHDLIAGNIISFGSIKNSFEAKDSMIENINSKKSGEHKNIINSLPVKESTVYDPYSNERTFAETSSKVKPLKVRKEFYFDPTDKPEATVVLAKTDNRESKTVENHGSVQDKSEVKGTFVVLAGVIMLLIFLILYAVTKRSKKSPKRKMALMQDSENNSSEMQCITKIFANDRKKNKSNMEEPNAKSEFLQTGDLPDVERDGCVHSIDSKLDKNEEPTYGVNGDTHSESEIGETNDISNIAPPLEITKAKIVDLHDSQPQTPTYSYRQENVKS